MRVTLWIAALCVIGGCGRKPKPAPPATQPAPTMPRPAGEMAPPLTLSNRSCGVETARLTGDRVGAIRLGMTADSVKRVCRVVRDTVEMPEGQRQRALIIAVGAGGSDTLRSWVSDSGRVDNVFVESSRFMTSDSLRVGEPLARLLAYPGMTGAYGEGDFYMFSEQPPLCGLSFRIDFGRQRPPFIRNPSRETLEPYANSARIGSILVRRCFAGR